MAREKPYYRETLDRISEQFPKEILTKKELAELLGVSESTVTRNWKECYLPKFKGYSKAKIAAALVS